MTAAIQPLHLLLMMFSGWVNRRQLDVIEYLKEENRILKERLGGKRIQFTDAERRRLARKAFALGRKVLNELETVVPGMGSSFRTSRWPLVSRDSLDRMR